MMTLDLPLSRDDCHGLMSSTRLVRPFLRQMSSTSDEATTPTRGASDRTIDAVSISQRLVPVSKRVRYLEGGQQSELGRPAKIEDETRVMGGWRAQTVTAT